MSEIKSRTSSGSSENKVVTFDWEAFKPPPEPIQEHKSSVTGVHWDKSARKWVVRLSIKGKSQYFGCFDDKAKAEMLALKIREVIVSMSN